MNARPTDPMTAQDGAHIQTSIQELTDLVKGFSNRIANLQLSNIQIVELLARIDSGLAENRVGRLEAELRESELDRDMAEQRLKAAEEKLNLKRNTSVEAVDTKEKIRAASTAIYADLERQKKENEAAFWTDVKRTIIKGVLVTLSISGVTGAIAFIWWLFMLYLNR